MLTVVAAGDEGSPPAATATAHEFTVPLGTGRLLDQGRPVDFFPARLAVRVGDTLVVHNEDNRMHTVGPYLVDRGETLRQTSTTPGTLRGLCTIHRRARSRSSCARPEVATREQGARFRRRCRCDRRSPSSSR